MAPAVDGVGLSPVSAEVPEPTKAGRLKRDEEDTKTDGEVTILSHAAASPKWTISNRNEGKDVKDSIPGPGSYIVHDNSIGQKGPNFGKAPRHSHPEHNEEGPGPAPAQDPSSGRQHVPGGVIGNRLSERRKDSEDTPGPGEYELRSTLRSSGTRMGPEPSMRPSSAPQSCSLKNLEHFGGTAPCWSFPVSERERKPSSEPKLFTTEQLEPRSTLRSSPAAWCNTASVPKLDRFEVRPDPATYMIPTEPPQRAHRIPKAQRPVSAPSGQRGSDRVGPGSYNTNPDRQSNRAPSLGSKTRRTRFEQPDGPGPAVYNGHAGSGSGPSFSIGKSNRESLALKTTPNGGYNELYSDRQSMTHTLSGPRLPGRTDRSPSKPGNNTPGPGSFDVPKKRPQRVCSFGSAARWKSGYGNGGPGPASYKTEKNGCFSSQGCGMPKSKREYPPKEDRSPGPGYYKAYSSFHHSPC